MPLDDRAHGGPSDVVDDGTHSVNPTYLLLWNPSRWEWTSELFDEQIAQLDSGKRVLDRWNTGRRQSVEPEARFAMIKVGDPPCGVFATGRIKTEVQQVPHFDKDRADAGDTMPAVQIEYDELLNPHRTTLLDRDALKRALPDVEWSPQASGTRLPDEAAQELEYLWQRHLKESGAKPLRLVQDIDQLRESVATFARALADGDERTRWAIFHPAHFIFDPANEVFAPAKWAGYRGMAAVTYAALQRLQNELKTGPRGFSGGRAGRHLEELLGQGFQQETALVELLESRFAVAFGEAALGNRDLSGCTFLRVPETASTLDRSRAPVSYWKLSPEAGGALWPTWRDRNIATIGWGELGDLSNADRAEFDRRVEEVLTRHPDWKARGLEQLWKFRGLRVGDRIVANQGTRRVLGIGTVIGGYRYDETLPDHRHHVTVRWDDQTERQVHKKGWRRTLIGLTKADFEEIRQAPPATTQRPTDAGTAAAPPPPSGGFDEIVSALENQGLQFPTEVVANYLLALQTKRFVILSGISGTGKTRLAVEVARFFQSDEGEEAPDETPAGAIDVAVRPYMLKYNRVVVPAELATAFLSEQEDPESTRGRLLVRLPDKSTHRQSVYMRPGTSLLQLLFAGAVKKWFLSTFSEGDVVRLSRAETDDGALLEIAPPGEPTKAAPTLRTYEVIPVRPDWTDHRGLLGFYNHLTQQYVLTPFLALLLRAAEDASNAARAGRPPRPFFAILDEMNLARVEHYFSDFLSALESGEAIELHPDPLLEAGETEQGVAIPRRLAVPSNLFFVGTVNVDETTYLFSPKVLDRAFTLELNDVDLDQYGADDEAEDDDSDHTLALAKFEGRLEDRKPNPSDWSAFAQRDEGKLRDLVIGVNGLLTHDNRHFGYRVANEIARFVNLAQQQGNAGAEEVALDLALLQKVLPKLHGTQQELEDLLHRLFAFGVLGEPLDGQVARDVYGAWKLEGGKLASSNDDSPRLPRFATKVARMLRRLEQRGFASFIE